MKNIKKFAKEHKVGILAGLSIFLVGIKIGRNSHKIVGKIYLERDVTDEMIGYEIVKK